MGGENNKEVFLDFGAGRGFDSLAAEKIFKTVYALDTNKQYL